MNSANLLHIKTFLVLLGAGFILPGAEARMYQWEHLQSGRIQLSGNAPAWYRSVHPGPRVLVFDNGKLVDDTAIRVGEAQRQFLRELALGEDAGGELVPDTSVDDERSLQKALTEAAKAGVDVEELASAAKQQAAADNQQPEGSLEAKVNELKALLSQWDAAKANEARAVLNGEPSLNRVPAADQSIAP
ncbi:MAG: hypothetical protein ACU84Q_09995 [Gammaproteobacteria bacterium]